MIAISNPGPGDTMALGIGRWVAWWAGVAPDHDAIVFDGTHITYSQMDQQVNRLANALATSGVEAGDRVAVLMGNRPEFLTAMFAAGKLGALLVPLNVRLVSAELEYIVGDARPKVLLSESHFDEVVSGLREKVEINTHVSADGGTGTPWDEFLGKAGIDPPAHASSWDDQLVISYTSGTTGRPKGAVLTHGNVFFASLQEVVGFGFDGTDRHLVAVPLCFTGGLLTASMPVFSSGGTMFLEREFDPVRMLAQIEEQQITRVMAVPVMFQALTQMPDFATRDLSSVKLALVGAAPVPPALVEVYHERGVQGFTNAYGLTEGAGFNLLLPSSDVMSKPGAYLPAAYTEAKVVDEAGAPVAPGELGELLLRGPTVMQGYWGNAAATNETIRGGWLHTGDMVRFGEDSYFYPVDRVKDMIITGGLNVYPAEVEAALFGHPKLAEVAVVGLPEEQWGEAVTAIAVLKPGEELTDGELRDFCANKLADYKQPKGTIVIDALPRNTSGKVLKRELRQDFAGYYD